MKEKETPEAQGASVIPRDVTGTKFSQFKRIESSENLEVVGVEGPVNVRMPLRTSNIATDPDAALFDGEDAPALKNQLEVNRYLAANIDELSADIEAGEALQAEILGRVEAGEAKQATIETNAMTKGGAQMLTADNWSIKDDGGATYAMISNGEITMFHVATPGAPKQPTNKEYVDSADKKMQTDISNLAVSYTHLTLPTKA